MEAPIYLFTGPEFGKRNDAVDSVKKSLVKKVGEIDEHLFYLCETPFSQVMTILQSGTLFSNGVFVVCKNAELLKKKDELQMISDWLETADGSAVLVLVSDEISVDSKLEKIVPDTKQNRQKFWEMFENEKLPWIINHFSKNGYLITKDAAQLVLDLVENNTEALKRECSRFFVCFEKSHEITEDDVDSILTHSREESVFTLFNQMCNTNHPVEKRFENSIEILQSIKANDDNFAMSFAAGLASCFRKLVIWHKLHQNSDYVDKTELKIHGLSGATIQKQYAKAAKVWTLGQAAAILANISTILTDLRTGSSSAENVMFDILIYQIVMKKGASINSIDKEEF